MGPLHPDRNEHSGSRRGVPQSHASLRKVKSEEGIVPVLHPGGERLQRSEGTPSIEVDDRLGTSPRGTTVCAADPLNTG